LRRKKFSHSSIFEAVVSFLGGESNMVSLLIYGFLFQLVFNGVSATTADDKLNGYRCNDYGVCLPGAEDIAVPPRTILANNTCGMEPYNNYCPLGQTRCFPCNSTSEEKKHPAIFMIDSSGGFSTSNFETWWQSQNWWEWYQENREQPLPVYITLSFNKSYVLTGEIKVTFKFNKPAKMVMEKSTDFGLSWTPLQYFADNCQERFGMEPSDLNCSTNAVLCSERYSDHNEGPLYFSFLNCYTTETFWDPQIQDLTEATDLRLRLEFPATDGLHVTKQENYLQKYFYAISDIQVFGRCQCHGHGENCMFPEDENNGGYINEPRCICRHKTEGVNCEKCQPLYNNKAWMPATSTTKSNPCESKYTALHHMYKIYTYNYSSLVFCRM
jgi:netrin-G1 ligand/netrin-G2